MGFFKQLAGISDRLDPDLLRPDLRECAGQLTGNVHSLFLEDASNDGMSPPEVSDAERFLAVLPSTRHWKDSTHRYTEWGVLYLTSARLFWRSAGSFEIPLSDLSSGGIRNERQRWTEYLHIGVGAANNPSYKFEIGDRTMSGAVKDAPSFDFFVEALTNAVRDSGARRSAGSSDGATSSADEIAKFAKLRDEGILSEEEFAAKKRELLG